MKKRWILLILPLMMNAASASELLGNVLSLVLNSPDDAVLADDCRADAEDARIIIASGAHYQLIAAAKQENGWESAVVSTNAVYQPSEGHGVPTLTRTEDGFELAYPEAGEVYRFALRHDSTNHPIYTLVFAKMGDIVVTKRENFGYLVTQGEDGAVWSKMVTLADFNIHQMPRGTADVRRMNEMACGLQRFANVRKDGVKEIRQEWRHVPIQTVCGTYLTDDPHVSEAHQEKLPAGTKLTALGYCGWAYVYVEAEVDGETLYGFVPQRDVIFDDVEQPELMAEFVGHWRAKGGGGWYDDFQLDADGNFSAADDDGERTCAESTKRAKDCNTLPVCIRRWFQARRAARSPMPCIPRRTRPLTARRRGKHPSARATIISCTSPWATGR